MFDVGIWGSKIEKEKESELSEFLLRRFLSIVLICKYKDTVVFVSCYRLSAQHSDECTQDKLNR